MTTSPDDIDQELVPQELRKQWAARDAAALARFAGVQAKTRYGVATWLHPETGVRVAAWRKRKRLYVATGTETIGVLTRHAVTPLDTWGQLETLVAGLVPRASEMGRVAS